MRITLKIIYILGYHAILGIDESSISSLVSEVKKLLKILNWVKEHVPKMTCCLVRACLFLLHTNNTDPIFHFPDNKANFLRPLEMNITENK